MAFYNSRMEVCMGPIIITSDNTSTSRWAHLVPKHEEQPTFDRRKEETWEKEVKARELFIPSEWWQVVVELRERRIPVQPRAVPGCSGGSTWWWLPSNSTPTKKTALFRANPLFPKQLDKSGVHECMCMLQWLMNYERNLKYHITLLNEWVL